MNSLRAIFKYKKINQNSRNIVKSLSTMNCDKLKYNIIYVYRLLSWKSLSIMMQIDTTSSLSWSIDKKPLTNWN